MQQKPCAFKSCAALASASSILGYCTIHNMVATSSEQFDLALKGKLTAELKRFAEGLDRGHYPKAFRNSW